jgi:hypothetical protein
VLKHFNSWRISAEALQLCWRLFPSWPLAYPRSPTYSPVWIWPFGWETGHNSLHTKLPVPWLARTGPWESRSLRDVRQSRSSSARVKTGDHIFGECLRHDYSLLFVIGALRCWRERRLALHPFCTASSGTTTPTSTMSTSVGFNAARYNLFRLLIVLHIIYIFAYYARSNFVLNFASGMFLLLISCIKLLVQLAKFPTVTTQSCWMGAWWWEPLTQSSKKVRGNKLDWWRRDVDNPASKQTQFDHAAATLLFVGYQPSTTWLIYPRRFSVQAKSGTQARNWELVNIEPTFWENLHWDLRLFWTTIEFS